LSSVNLSLSSGLIWSTLNLSKCWDKKLFAFQCRQYVVDWRLEERRL